MKYKEKLEAFIEDLSKDIPYIGIQCCGSCAWRSHIEAGNEVSFWISADDLDNKASKGVDINFIYGDGTEQEFPPQRDVTPLGISAPIFPLLSYAKSNDLSFYSNYNNGYVRMGVYSKRGKQEVRFYADGLDVTSKILNQDLAESN